MKYRKTRKGIWYWDTYANACKWAILHGWPYDRIIQYEVGWAVQARRGGHYAGPKETIWR